MKSSSELVTQIMKITSNSGKNARYPLAHSLENTDTTLHTHPYNICQINYLIFDFEEKKGTCHTDVIYSVETR